MLQNQNQLWKSVLHKLSDGFLKTYYSRSELVGLRVQAVTTSPPTRILWSHYVFKLIELMEHWFCLYEVTELNELV